uniref:Uncharacterized protein n=1 Tax=Plectus sambesii TaxID=2011161 RepID=A0A914VRN5_9BILA
MTRLIFLCATVLFCTLASSVAEPIVEEDYYACKTCMAKVKKVLDDVTGKDLAALQTAAVSFCATQDDVTACKIRMMKLDNVKASDDKVAKSKAICTDLGRCVERCSVADCTLQPGSPLKDASMCVKGCNKINDAGACNTSVSCCGMWAYYKCGKPADIPWQCDEDDCAPKADSKQSTCGCQAHCLERSLNGTCDSTQKCCGAFSKQCGAEKISTAKGGPAASTQSTSDEKIIPLPDSFKRKPNDKAERNKRAKETSKVATSQADIESNYYNCKVCLDVLGKLNWNDGTTYRPDGAAKTAAQSACKKIMLPDPKVQSYCVEELVSSHLLPKDQAYKALTVHDMCQGLGICVVRCSQPDCFQNGNMDEGTCMKTCQSLSSSNSCNTSVGCCGLWIEKCGSPALIPWGCDENDCAVKSGAVPPLDTTLACQKECRNRQNNGSCNKSQACCGLFAQKSTGDDAKKASAPCASPSSCATDGCAFKCQQLNMFMQCDKTKACCGVIC